MERSGSALFVDMGTSKRAFTIIYWAPGTSSPAKGRSLVNSPCTGGKTEAVRGEIAAQGHTASQRGVRTVEPVLHRRCLMNAEGLGLGEFNQREVRGRGWDELNEQVAPETGATGTSGHRP